jgi:hypothetical protein
MYRSLAVYNVFFITITTPRFQASVPLTPTLRREMLGFFIYPLYATQNSKSIQNTTQTLPVFSNLGTIHT